MVVPMKGPQKYHSAPGGRNNFVSGLVGNKDKRKTVGESLTCERRSAVVQSLQGRRGVDDVAAGKDIGLSDNALAIIT